MDRDTNVLKHMLKYCTEIEKQLQGLEMILKNLRMIMTIETLYQ